MRAMLQVSNVEANETSENICLSAVTAKPFGPEGESEENTFARWTPCGSLSITINNPNLFGKLVPGSKFYVDFTPVPDAPAPAAAPASGNGDDTIGGNADDTAAPSNT